MRVLFSRQPKFTDGNALENKATALNLQNLSSNSTGRTNIGKAQIKTLNVIRKVKFMKQIVINLYS